MKLWNIEVRIAYLWFLSTQIILTYYKVVQQELIIQY